MDAQTSHPEPSRIAACFALPFPELVSQSHALRAVLSAEGGEDLVGEALAVLVVREAQAVGGFLEERHPAALLRLDALRGLEFPKFP